MIIFINGSLNSGKSTIARLLAQKIINCANVEIDLLRSFIDWMPIDEAVPLNIKNAADVIRNFARFGMNVVVPYPLSQKNYDYFTHELLELKISVFIFTLNPRLEIIQGDRGSGKRPGWDRNRMKYHYEIGLNNPSFGTIIDNSDQTPEQTAQIIFDTIKR